ncbi:MAG: polysaccharide biosynthesis tyrosine autokinase [Bacteroidales bacterium]|nr:polysaccharide biosynthesis tyrosine autokinase [Bacteroidales bacterium]
MNKENNSFLSVSDLWRICLRRWKWFALSVALCLLFAALHLARTPKCYTSHAAILVKEESQGNNSAQNGGEEFADLGMVKQKNNVTNVVRHLTSLDILMEVARRVRPDVPEDGLLAIAQGLQSGLVAERESEKSTIINLSYTDRSPEKARMILTQVIQVYDDKYLEDKHMLTQNTSRFIDNRLHLLENDLDRVDDSISTYKSRHGITDLLHVSEMYLRQQSQSDAQILSLTNQKAMAQYIKELVDDNSARRFLLVNSGINNPVIEAQITQYNSLLMQLGSHLTYTSDQNPIIKNLEGEIESLRESIKTAIDDHIRTLDIELASLQGYHSETTSKITSNPAQAKYLASIEREQKVKESLYLYLLQKKEENEISVTYRSSVTRIIDIPHCSDTPTSPKVPRVLFAAILLGLLVPMALIFLRVTLDDSVRNRRDVEAHCEIPVLGEVPATKRPSTGTVVREGGKDPCNEAFRILRTKLALPGGGGKVFLVTSPEKGAGKTFVAMNLAMACALGGRKILFIDGDLRTARASALWKADGPGLAGYLDGSEADSGALLRTGAQAPSLDILPAGNIPANPSELLMNARMAALLAEARTRYDAVFIDSPTTGLTADADIMEPLTDTTLFVLRAGRYDRRRLQDLPVGRMQIIVNAVEA